ncbi:tail fiber protein [Pyxidicoccus trucidator]|uniref:tail fiber protein n=1 Tax=Pyxidicoccus trucidator TaxID=2709662 RepID=UPI0013DA80A5|nr:tail fiber protein [Pyxidicoccus trucidator]
MPYLGDVRLMSFPSVPEWWVRCRGQLLPIERNRALFCLLGTTYGGDGETTFALPDLPGVPCAPSSGRHVDEEFAEAPRTQTLTYCICIQGDVPSAAAHSEAEEAEPREADSRTIDAYVGEIRAMPYGFARSGWALCDGQFVERAANEALFSQLPNQGADEVEKVALPKLDPLAARRGALNYYISLQGMARRVDGRAPTTAEYADVERPMSDALVGEMRLFACAPPSPPGWLHCRGQSLPIAEHEALFELIGKSYGSWGIPTFALPNVAGPSCEGWHLNMFINMGKAVNSSIGAAEASDVAFRALDELDQANAQLNFVESGMPREQAGRAISAVLRLFGARPGTKASLEASAALSEAMRELPGRE